MRLIVRVLTHWGVLAAALAVTALLVSAVEIEGGVISLLLAAAVVGLVNALVGPVLRLLTAPLTLATLGVFSFVVNGALFAIAAGISDSLSVGGPLGTIVAAVVLSIVNAVLAKAFLD